MEGERERERGGGGGEKKKRGKMVGGSKESVFTIVKKQKWEEWEDPPACLARDAYRCECFLQKRKRKGFV